MKYRHKSGYGFGEWNVMIDLVKLFDLFKRLVGKKKKTPGLWGVLAFKLLVYEVCSYVMHSEWCF